MSPGPARVGIYLKRQDWGDPYIASDRIRGEWLMRFWPEAEEWRLGQSYDAVVFHNPVTEIINSSAPVKILDVCDPVWSWSVEEFRRLAEPVDVVVATTEMMGELVHEVIPDKPVRVIGDGHYFPYYETRVPNEHTRPAKSAVWFGYADNAGCLSPLLGHIRDYGLRLKVIAERNPFPQLYWFVDFVPWALDASVREISQADFAVLPPNKPYKSNNKEISALLCGIPVARSGTDIERLLNPQERQREMAAAPTIIAQHNVEDRAREYRGLVESLVLSHAV